MRIIKYNSFKEAVAAMIDFLERGIKCKGIDLTTLAVWDENCKQDR